MATHPMTPVDAAWFHMDGPANFALVTGILLTAAPLDFERVKALYRHRLVAFDRFRQRVVEKGLPFAAPHWEDMPDFDFGQQLHHIALPEPRDRAALVELISELASTPLDRERPLWQVHIVDNVDGGSALIMRMHHCIDDGTAARYAANCSTRRRTRQPQGHREARHRRQPHDGAGDGSGRPAPTRTRH